MHDRIQLFFVATTFISSSLFVSVYFTRGTWRSTVVGRALLFQAIAWATMILSAGSHEVFIFGSLPEQWISTVSLAVGAIAQIYMLYALITSLAQKD